MIMNKNLMTVLFACVFYMCACGDFMQVQENIGRLRKAQNTLLENPNDKQALSVMLDLLNSSSRYNRINAACVLGDTAEISERFRDVAHDKVISPLIELLDKGDQSERKCAVHGLKFFGQYAEQAVPLLRKNLFPSRMDVASESAEALGKIGAPAAVAVPDLLAAIKENLNDSPGYTPEIRRSATRALGEIGATAKNAILDLVMFLNESKIPRFRIEIAVALIRIDPNNQEGLSAIEDFLKNSDVEIRRETIWKLKNAGAEAKPAINFIKAARLDTDSSVSRAADELSELINKS